MNKKM